MTQYLINKLRFLSWHRGTKENDLILGSFADKTLLSMSEQDLEIFEQFLQEADGDIFAWITHDKEPPSPYKPLILAIRQSQIK
jgi:antitoxin CptB